MPDEEYDPLFPIRAAAIRLAEARRLEAAAHRRMADVLDARAEHVMARARAEKPWLVDEDYMVSTPIFDVIERNADQECKSTLEAVNTAYANYVQTLGKHWLATGRIPQRMIDLGVSVGAFVESEAPSPSTEGMAWVRVGDVTSGIQTVMGAAMYTKKKDEPEK
jgi:hypothetical protein